MTKRRESMGEEGSVRLDRRGFLKASAAGVAAATLPGMAGCADDAGDGEPRLEPGATPMAFDPEAVVEDEVLFDRGVQSGAVTRTSVLLWTRAIDSPPVTAIIWREDEEEGRLEVARASGTPVDGYLKLQVEGLLPGRRYHYAFFHGREDLQAGGGAFDLRSPIGRFRSAIAEDSLEPLTIAGCTCTGAGRRPYRALLTMAERAERGELDFMVHLGDIAYCDAASRIRGYTGRTPEADPDGSLTREAYREIWDFHLADPGYRELLSKTSWYMTWDDHEVDDNWNPEEADEIVLREAFAAFDENLATPRDLDGGRLWKSYRWGRTLELFVLDCRSERLPSTRRTDNPIYLGEEQLEWFKQGLRDSPCHFKVVLNSVPMAKMPMPTHGPWGIEDDRWDGYDPQRVEGGCGPVKDPECYDTDRWDGVRIQRREILDWIDEHEIENVVFLSGDFHVGFVAYISPNRPGVSGRTLDIAVGPSANFNPLGALIEADVVEREYVFPDEQFLYAFWLDQASTFVRFDPETNSIRVEFIDARPDTHGEVLHDVVYKLDEL